MSPNKIGYVEFYECCNNDAKTKSEAESLINVLERSEFFLGMVFFFLVWLFGMIYIYIYIFLLIQLKNVLSYFEKYQKVGFTKSVMLQKMLHLK